MEGESSLELTIFQAIVNCKINGLGFERWILGWRRFRGLVRYPFNTQFARDSWQPQDRVLNRRQQDREVLEQLWWPLIHIPCSSCVSPQVGMSCFVWGSDTLFIKINFLYMCIAHTIWLQVVNFFGGRDHSNLCYLLVAHLSQVVVTGPQSPTKLISGFKNLANLHLVLRVHVVVFLVLR